MNDRVQEELGVTLERYLKQCVLKALNLGGDTVEVIAGGLAEKYYGVGDIPME